MAIEINQNAIIKLKWWKKEREGERQNGTKMIEQSESKKNAFGHWLYLCVRKRIVALNAPYQTRLFFFSLPIIENNQQQRISFTMFSIVPASRVILKWILFFFLKIILEPQHEQEHIENTMRTTNHINIQRRRWECDAFRFKFGSVLRNYLTKCICGGEEETAARSVGPPHKCCLIFGFIFLLFINIFIRRNDGDEGSACHVWNRKRFCFEVFGRSNAIFEYLLTPPQSSSSRSNFPIFIENEKVSQVGSKSLIRLEQSIKVLPWIALNITFSSNQHLPPDSKWTLSNHPHMATLPNPTKLCPHK